MITKYQMISMLAEDTARQIARNGQEWMKYLDTAARLYKYPFNEQMLIYAQRPDASACASLETWNEKMNCWVNRGAKGIALIDTDSERPRLKYVFDVSDVHKARRIGRDPYLWELKEEHKDTVLARLEKTYGETDTRMPFEKRLIEIAERIAGDYYEELIPEIGYVREGSFLEELDELNVGIRLRDTLASSIAYTILSRCGADMEQWKEELDFGNISDFNTTKTLSVLGSATTEMCKPLLMEIGRTIGACDRQNARKRAEEKAAAEQSDTIDKNIEIRKSENLSKFSLANAAEADYNALKRESETQIADETETTNHIETEGIADETDIREEWRLSDSEPDAGRGAGAGADQVRTDAEELSEGAPERDLSGNGADGRAESTLPSDTGTGRAENGLPDGTDGESRGSGRGTESSRSDGLGSEDEQHQTFSGGNRTDRADLHLDNSIQQNIEQPEPDSESNSLSGSFLENLQAAEDFTELQKGILCSDEFLIHKRPEIAGYFQSEQDAMLQTEYLKNSFRMEEYTEFNIGENRAGYRADEDGLTMWKGNYLTREAEARISWEDARFFVNSYLEDGVYLLPGEAAEQIDTDGMYQQLDLFTMFSEQVGNIAMKQAEEVSKEPPAMPIPQEQLDTILRSGGGRENSRKRIYAKYRQGKTPEEMAEFLKKEYGTTGKGFEFEEKQVAVWFDEQGVSIGHGTSALERPVLTMSWQEIETQIRSQVESGTYMGANEAFLVDETERSRIANNLYFFFRDGIEEIDGGMYDNPDVGIREALHDIVEDLKSEPDYNGAKGNIREDDELIPMDYDELMEKAEAANRIQPQNTQSSVVEDFKAKTDELFHDISEMNPSEIEETVKCHVQAKIEEYDIDAQIVDVAVVGSRCRGLEREGSDLDVVVELSTKEREDDLFNAFNNSDGIYIGDIKVDINPITTQRTGSLENYLPQVEEYLESVRQAREQEPKSIFGVRMFNEERFFENTSGMDAEALCKAYAECEKPFVEMGQYGKQIDMGEFASIQQGERMSFSVEFDADNDEIIISDGEHFEHKGLAETLFPEQKEKETEITLMVSECSEFHNYGEFYENIPTVDEAIAIWRQIPPERLNAIPSIGINLHVPGTEPFEDSEVDILSGKRIDLGILDHIPDIKNSPQAMEVIAQLVAKMPEMEIDGVMSEEMEARVWELRMPDLGLAGQLAVELDRFVHDYDTYSYRNDVHSMTENVTELTEMLEQGDTEHITEWLNEAISEGIAPEEEGRAKELLEKLAEYKPLAKIEEMEEQNYNMIDNVLNNGAEKAQREANKKEQEQPAARVSLKARLAEKKAQVAGHSGEYDAQENIKKNQREM